MDHRLDEETERAPQGGTYETSTLAPIPGRDPAALAEWIRTDLEPAVSYLGAASLVDGEEGYVPDRCLASAVVANLSSALSALADVLRGGTPTVRDVPGTMPREMALEAQRLVAYTDNPIAVEWLLACVARALGEEKPAPGFGEALGDA